MADATPPPFQGPTAKERKYDRQLRLWAANGQAALEDAHILLVNSGPGVTGVEALKNLVLPGIGDFTILDPAVVGEDDLGLNFFLEEEDLGKSRAEATMRLLGELNPDVKGHAVTEPLETFIRRDDSLKPYTFFLVALPIAAEIAQNISDYAEQNKIPAFFYHSNGFYSHFDVQLPHAFPIVDTHPDPASTQDLRLLEPWAELQALVDEKAQGIETLDDEEHGHVPYLLILLHYLDEWKKSHGGKPPQNYKEKTDFREVIRAATRTNNPEGGEENFEEAVSAVLKSLNPHTPSSAVKEVFAAPECQNLTEASQDFWLIARGIQEFYSKHGVLPLSGSLPDMKAKSADYIALQNVYKSKARADVAEVVDRVRKLETQLKRQRATDAREIEAFCKSAGFVKLVRGRKPHILKPQTMIAWGERAQSAVRALSTPDSLMTLYIAFLAYGSYVNKHELEGVKAGETFETRVEKTTGIAHKLIDEVIKQAGEFVEEPEYSEVLSRAGKEVYEIVRAQGGELHNVAALTGGMLAQEAIKVITKQYVPVDNTCLYDGIQSRTSVLRL